MTDEELLEKFKVDAQLGLGPDLLIGASIWTPELAEMGLIQDLSDRDDIAKGKVKHLLDFDFTVHGILNYNKGCRNPPINVERGRPASDPYCVSKIYILSDYKTARFCYTEGRNERNAASN